MWPDTLQSFAVFLIHTERKKGVRASGVLFGYWLLCTLLPAISTAQQASRGVSGGLARGEWGPGPPGETKRPLGSGPVLPLPHTARPLHREGQTRTQPALTRERHAGTLSPIEVTPGPTRFCPHTLPLSCTLKSHAWLASQTHTCVTPFIRHSTTDSKASHTHTRTHTRVHRAFSLSHTTQAQTSHTPTARARPGHRHAVGSRVQSSLMEFQTGFIPGGQREGKERQREKQAAPEG